MKKIMMSAFKQIVGAVTPYMKVEWGPEEKEAAGGYLKGASYPGFTEKAEAALEAELGAGWSVRGVNLGKCAAQLALEGLQLPTAAEVIMPSYSDAGLIIAAMQLGLRPVLADVDERGGLRFESVMEAGSRDVKAIVVTHFAGSWAADLQRIIELARKKGIWVVEDARDARGLTHNGGLAGTFGDVGIFSSGCGNDGCSVGGAWAATRNPRIGKYIKTKELPQELRNDVTARLNGFMKAAGLSPGGSGGKRGEDGDGSGDRFKVFSMSGIDARLLLHRLPKLAGAVAKRREFAGMWRSALARLPLATIRLQPDDEHVYGRMPLFFSHGEREAEALRGALRDGGVETEGLPEPLHLQNVFGRYRRTSMDITDYMWRGAFCVPVRENLTDADWKRIDKALAASRSSLIGK